MYYPYTQKQVKAKMHGTNTNRMADPTKLSLGAVPFISY